MNRHHPKHPTLPLSWPERSTKAEASPPSFPGVCLEIQHPDVGSRAIQVERERGWLEAPGLGSLDEEGVNLGLRARTVSKKTWTLGITWVSFAPHPWASLQMAALASHSPAAVPSRGCLGLPALGAVLPPGARVSRQVHTSNKKAVAGFLPSAKREGLEGTALSLVYS